MARVERILAQVLIEQYRGAGTIYPVQTPSGAVYMFYIDDASDVVYVKTTDGGVNWSNPVTVFTGTVGYLSVWYDRWSNISAGLIHCAYTESTGHDVKYRSVDTENSDTLGSETTIFDGASVANAAGYLSICRARGGNIYCAFTIDSATEQGFYRSTDVGGTWGSRASPAEASPLDKVILLPGWAADNQDMMLIYADGSASGISRKLYDDSADSWAESAIIADGSATIPNMNDWPFMAATTDITNSRNVLVAWNARDALNADLKAFTVTEAAITTLTDVITNSTDDQATCGVAIETSSNTWYAFYNGKTDGSETATTSLNMYYRTSTDSGTTWGSETAVTAITRDRKWTAACPRFSGKFIVCSIHPNASTNNLMSISMDLPGSGGGIIGG